jgi:hypothetical protein
MAASFDYQLRDSYTLKSAVDTNLTAMKAKGFSDSSLTQFVEVIENLRVKEAAQQKAAKLFTSKVTDQTSALEKVGNVIKKIRNAAKSAYGKDERKLKLFKCDQKIPTSIGALITSCEYVCGLVLQEHDILLANGVTQEDIDFLNSSVGILTAASASKESALKLQKGATVVRDDASAKLKDKVFRIRKFAEACFDSNKEILLQFQPIPKLGGGRPGEDETKGGETPPENPTPPAK